MTFKNSSFLGNKTRRDEQAIAIGSCLDTRPTNASNTEISWGLLICLIACFVNSGCTGNEPRNLTDLKKSIVASNNAFALELYGRLKTTNDNLFFSPFSISSCLVMTYAGARNNTASQMADVLHFGTNQIQSEFGDLNRLLNRTENKNGIELITANGLWLQSGHALSPEFLTNARQHYDAEVKQVEFGDNSDLARADINKWVKEKTKGKIADIIPPGILSRDAKLVLINAIFFKGTWKTKFDRKQTRDFQFHLNDHETVQCSMMFSSGSFRHSYSAVESLSCQVIELPYKGEDFSLIAILPLEWTGLAELESKLTETNLANLLASVQETKIHVCLPKFKLETDFNLGETLSAMGMTDAFNMNADFSGMDGTKKLFISSARHRALVEMNEDGTTAAAATASHVAKKSKQASFCADHPFLFLIRDNRTRSIVFMGRLVNPTK